VVPQSDNFIHETSPWMSYGYTLWQPLIAKSQSMTDYHVFKIPSFLYDDLMHCFACWIFSGNIRASLLDDVVAAWTTTKSGKELASLLGDSRKWFIRLNRMSPKDSPLGGSLPSFTFHDIITKICWSMRAYGCFQSVKEDAEEGEDEQGLKMQFILNPWNAGMDPAKEFRVFVPPPAARGIRKPRIEDFTPSAISQYKWHSVLKLPSGLTVQQVTDRGLEGARSTILDIVAYMATTPDATPRNLLLTHGFSFDIALQDEGSVQIVEFNPFGAMSGCGACLFNLVIDGK
jgi:hypothetical protein